MDELNLDNLIKLGPQWWIVRVSGIKGRSQYTAEALARSLAKFFPDMDFKVGVLFFVLENVVFGFFVLLWIRWKWVWLGLFLLSFVCVVYVFV